jgi:NAD(P)-dependent dehydrogenase (short-subunit alcohol dehydrogenase family)
MAEDATRQVFLLTGAASGIGRHLAGALSARGHRVLATDVDGAALLSARTADGWPRDIVVSRVLDVRHVADWEAALAATLQSFGRLDVLLNIAGYLKPGGCLALSTEEVERHIDVNFTGLVHGTRTIGRYFVERRSGHIINFGSLASLASVGGLALYCATKFAVRGFSLGAAQEFVEHGVAVTVVMPDAVQTPMLELQVDYPEAALTFSGGRPLGVEDIERLLFEHVLPKRPLEASLPFFRGVLARLATLWPELAPALTPALARKGRAAQLRLQKARGRTASP